MVKSTEHELSIMTGIVDMLFSFASRMEYCKNTIELQSNEMEVSYFRIVLELCKNIIELEYVEIKKTTIEL